MVFFKKEKLTSGKVGGKDFLPTLSAQKDGYLQIEDKVGGK